MVDAGRSMQLSAATPPLEPAAHVELVQVKTKYGIGNTLVAPAGYVVPHPQGHVQGATLGLSAAAQALLQGSRVTGIQVIELGEDQAAQHAALREVAQQVAARRARESSGTPDAGAPEQEAA
jgi:hypothetical protein